MSDVRYPDLYRLRSLPHRAHSSGYPVPPEAPEAASVGARILRRTLRAHKGADVSQSMSSRYCPLAAGNTHDDPLTPILNRDGALHAVVEGRGGLAEIWRELVVDGDFHATCCAAELLPSAAHHHRKGAVLQTGGHFIDAVECRAGTNGMSAVTPARVTPTEPPGVPLIRLDSPRLRR